jgi:hypothetical protein
LEAAARKGLRRKSRNKRRSCIKRAPDLGGKFIVTVFDLLDRLTDVRQRHPDLTDWPIHVVVPDGCVAWANIPLEEVEMDVANKKVTLRAWSERIDGPDDDNSE